MGRLPPVPRSEGNPEPVKGSVNSFTYPGLFFRPEGGKPAPEAGPNPPQSTPDGDVLGEISGVVADPGQERGTHFRQPLQAEEIQAGHVGDTAAVNQLTACVQHRQVAPPQTLGQT